MFARFIGGIVLAVSLAISYCSFAQGTSGSKPIVILASGQSNFVMTPTFAWSPNANARLWNFTGTDGNVGTAFTPMSATTINITTKFASDVAYRTGRPVCLINVSFTGLAISHWLSGTGSPDVYQNILNNVPAALAKCGVTKIDLFLWWQGEADQLGSINQSYGTNFATMITRFWGNSWFPQETPVIMHSIVSTADQPGAPNADLMNDVLQATASSDADKRRFVYIASLHGATYWDGSNPGHMTGQGYFSAGVISANAYLTGPGRNILSKVTVDPASAKVTVGNPASCGAFLCLNYNANGIFTPATSAGFEMVQADSASAFGMMTSFGNPSGYVGRVANGSFAAPTAVTTDTLLSYFGAQGYDGAAWTSGNVANFKIYASEGWSGTAHGTYASVSGTKTGTLTQQDFMRWDPGCATQYGATSGSVKFCVPAAAGSNQVTFPAGTTDFTSTGGAAQYVKQVTAGGALTVGAISANEVTRGMLAQGIARSVVGVTGNATTNVADIQGTASQFLGVNSAGTALAFQTMSGDATLSGAAMTVTKVNGVDQTTAWTTYTPTVTSSSGAFTTVSATGRYKQLGKTIFVEANVTITTAGTAAGGLQATLPLTAAAFEYVGNAIEIAVTAKSGAARIPANGTTMNAFDASGTTFIASGRQVTMSAVYEVP